VQDADPTTVAGGNQSVAEGDLWTNVTAPIQTKVWHNGAWSTTATTAAPALIPTVQCIINGDTGNPRMELGFGVNRVVYEGETYTVHLTRPTNTWCVFAQVLAQGSSWPVYWDKPPVITHTHWIDNQTLKLQGSMFNASHGYLAGFGPTPIQQVSLLVY
jgi:hypothetical protein